MSQDARDFYEIELCLYRGGLANSLPYDTRQYIREVHRETNKNAFPFAISSDIGQLVQNVSEYIKNQSASTRLQDAIYYKSFEFF